MRPIVTALSFVAMMVGPSYSQTAALPSADEIMKRVAVNQDKADIARAQYVYQQQVRVITRRTNGKLAREEIAKYLVMPSAKGSEKKLEELYGQYFRKGSYHHFRGEPAEEHDSLDGDLTESFRHDLADEKSKDGLGKDLFPLTSEEQKQLEFQLAGTEKINQRTAYRISFFPRDRNEYTWSGEALIDAEEFQPITVWTKLSRRLPLAVRTLLGTDVPGLGFNVHYARQPDGTWFPVSFGTEFRLHAVFFINRVITVSLENKNFQHADVNSQIRYDAN